MLITWDKITIVCRSEVDLGSINLKIIGPTYLHDLNYLFFDARGNIWDSGSNAKNELVKYKFLRRRNRLTHSP